MKITFDSNTWRKIASPDIFKNDPDYYFFKKIKEALRMKKIEAFLSETIFTIESIQKTNRKLFFSNYKPLSKYKIESTDNIVSISTSIEPNRKLHPGNHFMINDHLKKAMEIGFKIVNNPRVGTVKNPDVIENIIYLDNSSLIIFSKACDIIENLNAGFSQIKAIGIKYNSDNWQNGIKEAPDFEENNIIKAVSEWADGDSVATHIAISGDYFCTYDKAKNAGSGSILYSKKIETLNQTFNIKVITPKKLFELIK